MIPTIDELYYEITTGPYKDQLIPFWNNVFVDPGPNPEKPTDESDPDYAVKVNNWRQTCRSYDLKRARAGILTHDGANDTLNYLIQSGRLTELKWSVSKDMIIQAKEIEHAKV